MIAHGKLKQEIIEIFTLIEKVLKIAADDNAYLYGISIGGIVLCMSATVLKMSVKLSKGNGEKRIQMMKTIHNVFFLSKRIHLGDMYIVTFTISIHTIVL